MLMNDVNMLEDNLQTVRQNTLVLMKACKDIGLEVNSPTKYNSKSKRSK